MTTITNEKIAGLEPRWASFRGFSLLFDHPGAGPAPRDGVACLERGLDAAPLRLYRALREGLARIGPEPLTRTHLLCLLPPSTYHVTVWDGIHDGNLAAVTPVHRDECACCLQELPGSLGRSDVFREITASTLVQQPDWNIRLRFERLENWSNVSLVARLGPADPASAASLARLTEARAELTGAFGQRFGVRPAAVYVPHVTLGYFANEDLAEQARSLVDAWSEPFSQETAGLALPVHRVRLYGFTDMATFFRPPDIKA
jgi:2'-5' RNA ligase